jgi:hypothetical protein
MSGVLKCRMFWFRIGIQPKMLDLDLDPDQMNADPQP